VAAWVTAIITMQRRRPKVSTATALPVGSTARHIAATLAWLLVVGVAATVVVESCIELSERVGIGPMLRAVCNAAVPGVRRRHRGAHRRHGLAR
jgi:hypothetical protein